MKTRQPSTLLNISSVLFLVTSVQGGYLGLTWEEDMFGLDGVTPLTDIAGYAGERVINVYAEFDNTTDQAVGAAASPEKAFDVRTLDGSGFLNTPMFGSDTPPSAALVGVVPELNWDSFLTVGTKLSDEQTTDIVIAAGSPGPNTDPWFSHYVSWLVPPTIDGVATPESVAGPDMRVQLIRLVVNPGTDVFGSFDVLMTNNGLPAVMRSTFSTLPAPGALALLSLGGLLNRSRRRRG